MLQMVMASTGEAGSRNSSLTFSTLTTWQFQETRYMRTLKWAVLAAALGAPLILTAASNQILGWNNLGMHCMDSDYSVFSILPPYNTIESQLIVGGKLVTNASGYTVTYQAVADPIKG